MPKQESKDTLREQVKKFIIKGISEGRFKYGERIVETRLAKELNVSQAPVREAIIELSIMGILEERPYSGSFVKEPEITEINNHYRTRGLIESFAASAAAHNRTEDELQEMREVLVKMQGCKNLEDFTELDREFHRVIVKASRNQTLMKVWETISTYEVTYQSILASRWTMPVLQESHQKLYDVIADGNEASAAAEMFLHLDRFRAGVLEHSQLISEK